MHLHMDTYIPTLTTSVTTTAVAVVAMMNRMLCVYIVCAFVCTSIDFEVSSPIRINTYVHTWTITHKHIRTHKDRFDTFAYVHTFIPALTAFAYFVSCALQ